MQYTVKELSRLTGLTPRTLRYYDAIGLLCPQRDGDNDYRLYGPAEVARLQQILLYREMGLPLEEIGKILDAPGFDRGAALEGHLERLREEKQRVETLIHTVERTLEEWKGDTTMSDKEKFEGMKEQVIRENEEKYGAEAREKYGNDAVDHSSQRIKGMSREEWERMQQEEKDYLAALGRAMAAGDPAGEDAKEACRLHMQWLRHTWKSEMCTPEAQMGLVEMYSQDERFRAYYDQQVAPGCADFFAKAVRAYYGE